MKKIGMALWALTFLGSVHALADDGIKIGVINLPEVLQQSPYAAEIRDKILAEFGGREEKLRALQEELQAESEKLTRDSAVMSESARQALQQEIMTKQAEFISLQESFREDTMRRQNEETQALLEIIGYEVEAVAQAEKLDMIIHRDAVPYIADEKLDVTPLVIEKLKKKKK